VIPTGAAATLNYYLRIGGVTAPFTDVFRVKVDGATVQSITEPSVAEPGYTLHSVNLSAYADGNPHTILFQYDTPSGGGTANFSVDDITLDLVCALSVPTLTAPRTQLANISTRIMVGRGDDVLIGGFIVTGTQAKKVMLRAIGPSLTPFGISGALADPTLEFHGNGGALIASNDNWQTTQIGGTITSSQVSEIQNSGLAPTSAMESAVIATVAPGAYTAILRGKNDTTGVAVVEAYDLAPMVDAKLANISTRGFVQTGNDILIGGLIVAGNGPATTVVRALGPSLGQAGIANPLQDPTLELHDGNGTLTNFNDNWVDNGQLTSIQATGLAPANNLESALLTTLSPGAYTAVVRGKNDSTGIALVEAYNLDPIGTIGPLAPLSALTLPGLGFDSSADVTVRFVGPHGFSVEIPAFDVTSASVSVLVPPYVDPVTQLFGAATVTVQVVQTKGSRTVASNTLSGLRIDDLPALQMPPGTVTANWAAFLESELSTVKANLAAATAFSGGQVDTTDLQTSLETCRIRFGELKTLIRAQLAGDPQTPLLAIVNSIPITLNSTTLRRTDQLLTAALQHVLSTAGPESPQMGALTSEAVDGIASPQGSSLCPLTTTQILSAVIHTPDSDSVVNVNYAFYHQQCADYYRDTIASGFSNLGLTLGAAGLVAPITFPESESAALILGGLSVVTQGIAARLDSAASALRANDEVAFKRAQTAWSGTRKGVVCFATSWGAGQFEHGAGVLFEIDSRLVGICETEIPKYENPAENYIIAHQGTPTPTPTPIPTPSPTPVPCSSTQVAGGDTGETRTIQMGRTSGTFNFSYDTYTVQDRMLVIYEGKTLFDTGCVGASGSVNILYIGTSTTVTVQVIPNCAGGSGTQWTFTVGCPM
jgi:hypothetical protein